MLNLEELQNYLKGYKMGYNKIFLDVLDAKLEKVISITPLNTGLKPEISIGGKSHNAYEIQSIALLVHWNKDLMDTQTAAYKLYNLLSFKRNFKLSENTYIHYIKPRDNEPKYVGKDETSGIREYVLEFYVYYSNLK